MPMLNRVRDLLVIEIIYAKEKSGVRSLPREHASILCDE